MLFPNELDSCAKLSLSEKRIVQLSIPKNTCTRHMQRQSAGNLKKLVRKFLLEKVSL